MCTSAEHVLRNKSSFELKLMLEGASWLQAAAQDQCDSTATVVVKRSKADRSSLGVCHAFRVPRLIC